MKRAILLELQNIDLVESRLLSFKRNHFVYLKSIKQERVTIYLKFVEAYYKNPKTVNTKPFSNKAKETFNMD